MDVLKTKKSSIISCYSPLHVMCRWHRLGISVKGNSATALLDCAEQDTKEIQRAASSKAAPLPTDGIILYGQEIDDETFFDVSACMYVLVHEIMCAKSVVDKIV